MNPLIIIGIIVFCVILISGGGYYEYSSVKSAAAALATEEEANAAKSAAATQAAATAAATQAAAANTNSSPATTIVAGGTSVTAPPAALTGTAAVQLGVLGLAPWGSASKFVDLSAQWIWNLQSAATSAPANVPIKFSNQWNNTTGADVPAVLHVIVDDTATVNLNGVKVKDIAGGWTGTNYPQMPITLKSGNNIIDIIATNSGGPAALIVSLVKTSDSSILLRSDASWVTNAG